MNAWLAAAIVLGAIGALAAIIFVVFVLLVVLTGLAAIARGDLEPDEEQTTKQEFGGRDDGSV